MAAPVEYQSFCPVGASLNVVGERWALLIVRDLLLGPRRYSELLNGLGGIGTDILAARLRTLTEHGVLRQIGAGRSRGYELTDEGQALRPVLEALGRWGAPRLRLPEDPAQIPLRVPLTSLLLGATALPRRANGVFEVGVEDEHVRVEVAGGEVRAAPDREPDATLRLTWSGLRSLILGERVADADVVVTGDARKAHALLDGLTGPPLLAGLRDQLGAG
ncbi:MAG: helix-turn-helix transcriptional regulator [Nocardioidaceae bacterium]|nr:helix-turn-helix transcriptional regulator [Nocardioidaceae bacterium]